MKELIIAEKPKAALRIALALAPVPSSIKKKNFFGVPFYEIKDEKENKEIIVASAVGHLFEVSETKKSFGWPVFDVEWKPTEVGWAKKYIKALSLLSKQFKPDTIIIACDYDTEGELIGYNILRFIFNKGPDQACRMKFSTLTKQDLLSAYKNKMPSIDFNQAIAGETRHILDWFYGINLSRALMSSIKGRKILSIGRVQGPALALIVEREQAIEAFKPEKFWKVVLEIEDKEGNMAELVYSERIKEKERLDEFNKLKGRSVELEIVQREQELAPFPPFNLTDLQMEAYRLFGFDPAKTLAIAQELYLAGLISYPRTSSQKLPTAIGYKTILQKLQELELTIDWSKVTRQKPVEGKATDPAHPAIFPTGEGELSKLSKEQRQLYELIVKRFVACFCENAILEIKNVRLSLDKSGKDGKDGKNGKVFEKSFKRIKEANWLELYPYQIKSEWSKIGEAGKSAIIKAVHFQEGQTEPPSRYNPASIVKELEKRHLGTKATRAQIIEIIYKRGYIKGKTIKPSPLGIAVVKFLKAISPLILDEALTRKFELELDKILISKNPIEEKEKILSEAKEVLLRIARDYEANKEKLIELLHDGAQKAEDESIKERTIAKCDCGGSLILKKSSEGNYFVGCTAWPDCKAVYSLPKGYITVSNGTCSCGWRKLRMWKNKRSFEICANSSCKNFWLKKVQTNKREARKSKEKMAKLNKRKEK
ncbi:MAG: DNA topoisomerase I [Candidatus Pacearchaeota archaeon]